MVVIQVTVRRNVFSGAELAPRCRIHKSSVVIAGRLPLGVLLT
jgi:hypothetical protein